jgi:hypothetical protein
VAIALTGALTGASDGSPSADAAVDETGELRVDVPGGWDDVERSPLRTSGGHFPYVLAAPDLEAYRTTADAPGFEILKVEGLGRGDVTRLLEDTAARLDADSSCSSGPQHPYGEEGFEGRLAVYTDCGPAGTELWLYAIATPLDDAVIVVGIRGADPSERARVLRSVTRPG